MFTHTCVIVAYLLLTQHETTLIAGRVDTSVVPTDFDLRVRSLTGTGERPIVARFAPMPKFTGKYFPCLYLDTYRVTRYAKT